MWSRAGLGRSLLALAGLAVGLGGCEIGKGPVGPTSPGSPAAATVSGRVVSNRDSVGIPGALVEAHGLEPARTDASGRFTLEGAQPGQRVTISADAHLTRDTSLSRVGDPAIDLISLAPPFSLDFYRELGRAAVDSRMLPLLVWNRAPRFYVTTTDRQGQSVPAPVVALVTRMIHQTSDAVTGGGLGPIRVETGAEARALATGWITVEFTSDPAFSLCGQASVGGDPGWILLSLNQANDCGLGLAPSPGCVAHEVAHTLGLWHASAPGVMQPVIVWGPICASGRLTPTEQHHSRIMYSRPRDNVDADVDPVSLGGLRASGSRPQYVARCGAAMPPGL